jgi:cytochrome c oxidase assembly factor CtaG
LHEWSIPIPTTILLTLVAFWYVCGFLRLRKIFPRVITFGSGGAFIGGIISIWVAVASPLSVWDHELLSAHMVRHLLLMAIAPPLIFLGRPAVFLLHFTPKQILLLVGPFLRWAPTRWMGRIILHPIFCWTVATLTVIVWHIPAVFALGVRSHTWHEIQHVSFLLAGFLFWWPVVRTWPSDSHSPTWSLPLYLFLATLPCDVLSAFLTFCDRVIYPNYLSAMPRFPISALQDQEWAGVIMWTSLTFIYMVPALILTVRLLSPQRPTPKVAAYS